MQYVYTWQESKHSLLCHTCCHRPSNSLNVPSKFEFYRVCDTAKFGVKIEFVPKWVSMFKKSYSRSECRFPLMLSWGHIRLIMYVVYHRIGAFFLLQCSIIILYLLCLIGDCLISRRWKFKGPLEPFIIHLPSLRILRTATKNTSKKIKLISPANNTVQIISTAG